MRCNRLLLLSPIHNIFDVEREAEVHTVARSSPITESAELMGTTITEKHGEKLRIHARRLDIQPMIEYGVAMNWEAQHPPMRQQMLVADSPR